MYIIIVGAGDIGTPLIEIAIRSGNEVVVIEKDDTKADQVASEHDCLVLNADATTKEILEDAGATQADAMISTTDQDATNIMVCLLATEYGVPSILSVVHDPVRSTTAPRRHRPRPPVVPVRNASTRLRSRSIAASRITPAGVRRLR